MTRVEIVNALRGSNVGRCVADAIEYGEGIAVFQDQQANVLQRSGGGDLEGLMLRGLVNALRTPCGGRGVRR